LISDKIPSSNIIVTGNTIVDSVKMNIKKINGNLILKKRIEKNISKIFPNFSLKNKYVVITCHRRENSGEKFDEIMETILDISKKFKDINFVFPKHLNPNVQPKILFKKNKIKNLFVIKPIIYHEFIWLLHKSYVILSDSGGIQEEGATLKKPILIMREKSERPEAINSGFAKLVGTDRTKIISNLKKLLYDRHYYNDVVSNKNPFGNGKASETIINFIRKQHDK